MQADKNSLYFKELSKEFTSMVNGQYVKNDTGEIFTQAEITKYFKVKVDTYRADTVKDIDEKSNKTLGVVSDKVLVNKKTKKIKVKKVLKEYYSNGDFNMVYRPEVENVHIDMKLNSMERIVYLTLRDFVVYPSSCLMFRGEIPTMENMGFLTGLNEKTVRKALKSIEKRNLIKSVNIKYRKAIYFNPKYYSTGKNINKETLKMFGLLQLDDDKIREYLND
jgi:hypothetical protein